MLIATYLIKLPTLALNGISHTESIVFCSLFSLVSSLPCQVFGCAVFVHSSPLVSSLPYRVFGCVVFVNSHNPNPSKLRLSPSNSLCLYHD